ncbi:hypothetical protein D910_00905 [Dendroctonus ponderosae]|uniref:Uncharacterized protein n=1 Tax=Dendroctonus ponderosae TaxID=77166 RepID=U4V094_DENPD|nr:hypothetical protein D910_00905 [Dendroctonus ponderosae]
MWQKLLAVHEQKTEVSNELLWQKFYDYRMVVGDSIAAYLSKIESIVKKLRDIKEPLSESAICSKVINSVPQKFNAFRTAWDSVTASDQTFTNLTARLLKDESRKTATDDETTRLALQAKLDEQSLKSNKKKSISEIKRNTNCNYCKKKGH